MAQYESGTYTGKGFSNIDANGFSAKLDDWLLRSSGSGGAGWTLVEDGSTLIDKTFQGANISNELMTIVSHGFFTGQKVTTNSQFNGIGYSSLYFVRRIDEDTISFHSSRYDAENNVNRLSIYNQSSIVYHVYSCPYKVYANKSVPVVNDNTLKIIELWNPYYSNETNSATRVNITMFMWWDTSTHLGRGGWAGKIMRCDSGSLYMFLGDTEYLMLSSSITVSDPSYYSQRVIIIDNWSSVTGGYDSATVLGTLSSGISSGRRVVVSLGSGEANGFTVGGWYYIYNFNNSNYVEYVKVIGKDIGTHTITVDQIDGVFVAGSKIGAYPHRFFMSGFGSYNGNNWNNYSSSSSVCQVPYYSRKTKASGSYPNSGTWNSSSHAFSGYVYSLFVTARPDDRSVYPVQRPMIVENYDANNVALSPDARLIGRLDHTYVCPDVSLVHKVDLVTVNTKNYLFIGDLTDLSFSQSSDSNNFGLLIQAVSD